MSSVAIVANGQFPRKEYPLYLLRSAGHIICCDGALTRLEKAGIVPDVVIGDLDSVCGRALRRFKGIVVKNPDQETNDLTKAVTYTLEHFPDASEIHILAATGKSEAHTMGNISLLMQYEKDFGLEEKGISLDMVSDYSTASAFSHSGDFHIGQGRRISIFTADSDLKIHSEGLQWPLDNVVFDNWWKGTLNIASEDIVHLELSHPSPVLLILD